MKDAVSCHSAEKGLERERLEAGGSVIQVRVRVTWTRAEGNGQIQGMFRKNELD